jgi:hypothetical protein
MEVGIWFCAWFWFQFQFWFLKIRAACGQVVGNLTQNLEPLVSSSSSHFFSIFSSPKISVPVPYINPTENRIWGDPVL